ncbi:bifunctional glycosyltransferase/CDP-glycerol:glycerophosphate glycerophosphotransferase [Brevibacterium aurantiacum]|uniref:bifunctional glycosyltransferase/CDP-glycerol:glycerophosphate glycerophosphotransferase n=1 Tax=Brevibacterium aurantiacum TaxID=273384 RepID=UPI0018663605|nr:CDP-glycerol glycerophosphotransferase family protein [Brevibacterium aurantiacum]
MIGRQWRKALWHTRHGGLEGLRRYRQNVATAVHATPEHGGRSLLGRSPQDSEPALSVIVPAYNASGFIDSCLRSILSQTGVALEIIVVDDGSTDDTASIAGDVELRDHRVTVLRAANSGPAAARNLGVLAARGTFIAFADADDEVLPGAYQAMVDSLDRTGSDIATGSYVRLGAGGRSRPKVTAQVHSRQRLAVRIGDMPELLEEPVLWNKIYRRDFWNRHVGEMTTFTNYEDQEPVYRALAAAAAIDVLNLDVYVWRMAEGRDTRSRRKGKLTDLRARLKVINALTEVLEYESEEVRDRAYATWMGRDLAMHAEFLGTAGRKFRKTLGSAASDLKKTMSRNSWSLIPAQERLLMWVVAAGRLDDIEEVLGTRAEETTAVPLEHVEGEWFVAPSYVRRLDTRIPKRVMRAQAADFKPQTIIRNAQWVDQHVIELQGCAFIPGIDPKAVEVRIQGVMDGAVVFDSAVDHVNDNRIDLEVGDPWRSYSMGGFRVRIDLEGLKDLSPRGIDIFGRFDTDGVRFHAAAESTTVVGMIAPSPVVHGARVTVVADEHSELSIRPVSMSESPVLAKSVTAQGSAVTVTLNGAADISRLELNSSGQTVVMSAQGRSIFTAELPELPERFQSGGERSWSVSAVRADKRVTPVSHEAVDYLLPGTSCVRLSPNIEGAVRLEQRYRRVTVTGASSDRDRLLITGRIDPPKKLCVVLRSSEQTFEPAETSLHADGTFTAVYDLTAKGPEGGVVASMSGGYHVRYGGSPETAHEWARVAEKLAIRPVDCFTPWNTIRMSSRNSGAAAITASPPWSARERTKFGLFALRDRDWGPLRNGIVFESYNGKTANDNPRAIFDAIRSEREDIPLYWSVRDRRVDVPEGGIPVVEGTAAWHEALATSRVWVNNNNFPYYVRKRPGQFYLQTWHGTPIKKLLWDIPRRKVPLTYRRLMKTEVPQWDLLLAQSEEAVEHLRSGLGYQGEIQVGEYPRNQRLVTGLEDPKPIRERFGITASAPVILYAPTWRERHRAGSSFNWGDYLDPQKLAAQTGAVVLVRAHHVTNSHSCNGESVLDVSAEHHVEDLLAIADIVITDYSSLVFDHRLTGRPLALFTPDICDYRKERGLYDVPYDVLSRTECQGVEDITTFCCEAISDLDSKRTEGSKTLPTPVKDRWKIDTCRNLLLSFQQPLQQTED